MTLDKIGKSHGTDKSSDIHDYLRKYEKYLPFNRYNGISILEIGVLDGASLKTWNEYYFKSSIVGIDVNPDCKKYESESIKIEIGSQTDMDFLDFIIEKYPKFDMIIDDGSHINSDVIQTFKKLFQHLNPQGVYIVEDTCTSYWRNYGGGLNEPNSMVSYFKGIIDEVNFFGELLKGDYSHARKDCDLIERFSKRPFIGTEIESINFLNSIIIITKR